MSEFNFDKMRNFKAPDEWAEKTISIVNEKRRARYYRMKKMRICAACLCLIILCMFSFTFCIKVLGESFITPVNVDETVTKTDSEDRPIKDGRENSIWDDEEEFYEESKETSVTEAETTSLTEETRVKETDKTEALNEKEKETQKPTSAKNPSKTEKDPQSKPNKPNNNSAVRPTQKPAQKPSADNKPKPTQAPPVDIEPTETPIEYRVVCSTIIDKSLISSNDVVYCRIYDCDNDVYLGDDDIFSSQHMAENYGSSDSGYYVRYYPVKRGVITSNGEYIVMFYDAKGKNLKTFGYTVKEF